MIVFIKTGGARSRSMLNQVFSNLIMFFKSPYQVPLPYMNHHQN